MKIKIFKMLALILAVVMLMSLKVSAASFADYQSRSQYYSYEYNSFGEISSAPDGYIANSVVHLNDLGVDMTDTKLTDFCFDGANLYLLDAGLGRIIVLNADYTFNRIINPADLDKSEKYSDVDIEFKGAGGIYIDAEGRMLICDTQRERVLVIKTAPLWGLLKGPTPKCFPTR